MSLFNSASFVRHRYPNPVRTKGRITNGTAVLTSFKGSFQPAKGDSTMLRSEHESRKGLYWIFTALELRAVQERDDLPADEVIFKTARYKVIEVALWQNDLLNHFRATVELVGRA